ncbi:uncharacterized protein LOC122393759 isoform X2 [Amphibalanus amphitrite]|uniref:uncharacterized protein LOC122393759 isoform X2 n=1 Tax=Amphibalanus amphitrite TaxID=1232801 RepID=UPI001C91D6EA|nr:uncharacterized protein LOC122393759 isoform X2 [Amphibalanus amphitrite]
MDTFLFGDSEDDNVQPMQSCGVFLNNGKGKSKAGKGSKRKARKGRGKACKSNAGASIGASAPASTELHSAEQDQLPETDEVPGVQTWSTRQAAEAENWDGIRSAIFQDVVTAHAVPPPGSLCSICGSGASVMCDNCPVLALCRDCDVGRHTSQPFHRRRHWTRGFLEALHPSVTVSATGEYSEFAPLLPLHGSQKQCFRCSGQCDLRASSSTVIVITLQGRFDLHLPMWSCSLCNNDQEVEHVDLVRCGFYRASPVRLCTVVHEAVFITWQELRSHSPGTSLTAFVAALQELGKRYGCRGPVDLERLEKAFTEWTCVQFELQGLQGSDYMECEACGADPKCVHLDGNAKLYRYRSSGSSEVSSAYHVGTFIADKTAVDAHVTKLSGVTKTSNRCGLSSWAAGRNNPEKPPSKRSQDETGLIVATCRHSVILAGCNMYRGESYAYSHYLHQSRFPAVKYYASDIVCKYWPWTQRVSRRWPEYDTHGSEPFLSVMHATGHAYYCQITFGGFWREGSGWSVMETTEIANAFLSRACNTTKYMTSAQRNDALTDMVLKYNEEKHRRMPTLLIRKMKEAERRIPMLQSQLDTALRENGISSDHINSLVDELRNLAASLSSRDVQSHGGNLENAIEMVSDSVRVRHAATTNAASTAKGRARYRRLVSADKLKLSKLLAQYERENGTTIEMTEAVEGVFPWHVQTGNASGIALSLSAKRAVCDLHMRLERSREELEIVQEEMLNLVAHSKDVVDRLCHTLTVVTNQIARPEEEREAVLEPVAAGDRYSLRLESTPVLHGLQALLTEAVIQRGLYLEEASSVLRTYLTPGSTKSPTRTRRSGLC